MNEIDLYIDQHTSVEPDVLRELTRQTHLRVLQPRMLSGHVQGRFLAMLTSIVAPRRVLELGTFTAYSTISMALAMDADSELFTVEIDDELEAIAAEFIAKAGVQHIVHQVIGDAVDVMRSLSASPFDMVFIDADKRQYVAYYNALWDNDLVHSGTVILADNTLWDGKVVEQCAKNDTQTAGIQSFNDMIMQDDRVDKILLPLRDGITIIRVK